MTLHQERLLDMMREIEEICKKHRIEYYLAGGSLIGAIRHEGFVPWDDDADIVMTRNHWNKLVEVAKTELPEHRVLEAPEINPEFPNAFGRYTNTETAAIHTNQILGDGTAGMIIDVFILDPLPDDKDAVSRYRKDILLYSELINEYSLYSYRYNANRFRYPLFCFLKKIVGKQRLIKYLADRMFSYKEEECPTLALRWGGNVKISDKDYYRRPRYAEVEGVPLQIPSKPIEYLVWHFGDEWMYIPPHGEREGHVAIHNEDVGYKTIQDEYIDLLNAGKLKRAYARKRAHFTRKALERHGYVDENANLVGIAAKQALLNKIEKNEMSLEQLYSEERFAELREFFDDFLKVQLSAPFIGRTDFGNAYRYFHPVLIELDDKLFCIILMTLIHTNAISKAFRLLEVYKELNGDNTEEQMRVLCLILDIRTCMYAFYEGKLEEASKVADNIQKKYSENLPQMLKVKISILLSKANAGKYMAEIQGKIEKLAEVTGCDGEVMKFQGDVAYLQQKKKAAYILYCKAAQYTNNGMVLLDIKHMLENNRTEYLSVIDELNKSKVEDAVMLLDYAIENIKESDTFVVKKYDICLANAKKNSEIIGIIEELSEDEIRYCAPKEIGGLLKRAWEKVNLDDSIIEQKISLMVKKNSLAELESYVEKRNPDNGDEGKLIGDIYTICGRKDIAFGYYRKALEQEINPYTFDEIVSIYIKDWKDMQEKVILYKFNLNRLRVIGQEWEKKHLSEELYRLVTEKLKIEIESDEYFRMEEERIYE